MPLQASFFLFIGDGDALDSCYLIDNRARFDGSY